MAADTITHRVGGGEEITALLMDINMFTAAVSAILLLVLVGVYIRVYRDTHAQFSLGLSIFASIMFVQNALAVFSFMTMGSYVLEPFLPFLLVINIAQVLGVIVLLRTAAASSRVDLAAPFVRCTLAV